MSPISASLSHCPKRKGRNNCCFVCSSASEIVSTAENAMRDSWSNVTGVYYRRSIRCGPSEALTTDRDSSERCHPFFESAQGHFALFLVALFTIANASLQGWEQVEGDVGGLEAFGVCLRYVVEKRPEGGSSGWADGKFAVRQSRGLDASQKSGRDGLDVAFDAANLSSEEEVGVLLHLQRVAQ